MTTKGFIDVLKTGILGFAERNPRVIVVFHKGDCVIEEGVEGTEIFLIKQGTLSVSVKDPVDRAEKDVALRFDGGFDR